MTTIIRGSDNFDSARVPGLNLPANVTGSRALNVDYTNNSGGVRIVRVFASLASTSIGMRVSFDSGVTWMTFASQAVPSGTVIASGSFYVPPGATYRVGASAGTPTIAEWWEQ